MPRKHIASYNWRTDPAYKMSPTHQNKMMRPQTHTLLQKLRDMKIMQEPGMANVVIHDLAHWFLYRKRETVLLGEVAADLMKMWTGLVYNAENKPAYIYGQPENSEGGHWDQFYSHWHDGEYNDCHICRPAPEIHPLPIGPKTLNNEEMKASINRGLDINEQRIEQAEKAVTAVTAGDSPPEKWEPVVNLKEHLKNTERKKAVESTIELHVPKIGKPAWAIDCSCGRTFAHSEEWANHVRIRVYRVLLEEFPAIGTPDAAQ